MRIEIYVRPGASRRAVGGTHDGALVVRIAERPEQGRATAAALEALADALDLPHRGVTLVRGATSRRKLVGITLGDSVAILRQIEVLRQSDGQEHR